MGNDQSKRVRETALVPQPRFPRVTNQRFIHERVVSLLLQNGFWSHSEPQAIEIKDVDTNKTMFKVPPPPSDLSKKQVLADHNGVPIATLDAFFVGPEYAVYCPSAPRLGTLSAAWHPSQAMCFLQTNTRPLERPLRFSLPDPSTGGEVNITIEGVWRNHRALIWLDRGVRLQRSCIGRVYCVKGENTSPNRPIKYQVDIAPGVDVALVVLACAALDDEFDKKAKDVPSPIGTDPTTLMLVEHHYGMTPRDRQLAKAGKGLFVGIE